MIDKDNLNDSQKMLFINLIMMLSSSAMQQLGLLVNPITKKTEINLEGAQISIDMLEMIRAKTAGNLDKEEEKMLKDVLSSLQMNYVTMAEREDSGSSEPAPKAAATDASPEKETTDTDAPPAKDDKGASKFHKTYG